MESRFRHLDRAVDIAQIDEDRLAQQRLDALQIECAKLVPLRDDDQSIGTRHAFIGIAAIGQIGHQFLGLRHAFGIECADRRPGLLKCRQDAAMDAIRNMKSS